MLRIIAIAIFATWYGAALCQHTRLARFTTDDGLPENTGQAIIQDDRGFIWIGTQNGLARYDGYEFKSYTHKEEDSSSLVNNQVEALLKDRDGRVWVATRNGMNVFDPLMEEFQCIYPYPAENFGRNWFGTTLLEDSTGHIWAHSFYGVYRFQSTDPKSWTFLPFPDQSQRNMATIALDPSRQKVWASVNGIIYKIENNKLIPVLDFGKPIFSMQFQDSKLYAGTTEGVEIWDLNSNTREVFRPDLFEGVLCVRIYFDPGGRLWVLSNNGVYVLNENELVFHLKHRKEDTESLSHNLALSIFNDDQGLIWIGTGQGVNVLDPLQDRFLRINSFGEGPIQLPDQHVEVIRFSGDSILWIGTSAGVLKVEFSRPAILSKLPANQWPIGETRTFTSNSHPSFSDDNVDYILPYKDGALVGTSLGHLYRIGSDDQIQKLNTPSNFVQLRGLYLEPEASRLWCASADALFVYDLQTNTSYIPEWIPDIDCTQMGVFNGEIWLGSPVGIYIVDPDSKKVRIHQTENATGGLSNTMLTHSYSTDSVLWFSTFGGGLINYNPKTNAFNSFGSSEELENNNVWSVYADRTGKLWCSTDKGIAVFNPEESTFSSYGREDGLNFSDFSMTAHAQSPRGEIWMGNPEGITVFHPDNFKPERRNPKLAITNVDVNYTPRPDHLRNILSGRKLILQPEEKTLSLTLSVLDFRKLRKCKLAFKLDGYHKDWVEQDALDRSITFTNLPSGNHRLEYKAAGYSGSWGPVSEISVQVIPPFYETWWFRALVVMIILLVVIIVIFSINRRKYQKRILQLQTAQKIQTERERISKDLHDHVGAHLTRIVTDLDILELKMDRSSNEDKLEQIESTRGFTSNTIQLLRDTIWAINKDYYSADEFAEKARAFLEQYLEKRVHWTLESKIERERQLGPNEVLNLLRILQEATQNMLKYAKAERFEVIVESGESFILLISDDGVGMDKPLEKQGHYGMQNMKKRAQDIGADFEIKTAPGKGVQIRIELSRKKITARQPG